MCSLWMSLLLLVLAVRPGTAAPCPDVCQCTAQSTECVCTDTKTPITVDQNIAKKGAKTVNITNCAITAITKNAFSSLESVQSITFDTVAIESIEGLAFDGMTCEDGATESGIVFKSSVIGGLEQDAFKGIQNADYLEFFDVEIKDIGTKGISDSSFGRITFGNSKIQNMEANAFGSGLASAAFTMYASELLKDQEIPSHSFAGFAGGKLKFNNTEAGHFMESSFAGVSDVDITISEGSVVSFRSKAFGGALNIKSLTVENADIDALESDIFGDMSPKSDQSKVAFTGLVIKNMQGVPFQGLSGFKSFEFSDNQVKCLEEMEFINVQAEKVESNNQIPDTVSTCNTNKGAITRYSQPLLVAALLLILVNNIY